LRPAKLLQPDVDFVQLEEIRVDDEKLLVVVTSIQTAASCPNCGQPAYRERGQYSRQPSDLCCMGRKLRLQIDVRRFFCDNPDCERRTLAGRLPSVVKAFGRRTERLAELQRQLGLVLSGEAGSRYAQQQGVLVNADTLLRVVRRNEQPTVPTPRVLGIYDWACRKRQRNGTILVDLEWRRVVEILPDRPSCAVCRGFRLPGC
jgi:transposase